jgi:hypothetical protein
VYVPWDVEEYYIECVKTPVEQCERNKYRFPCPFFGRQNQPLTIVDIRGRIVLWYLPDLLSPGQMVSHRNSILCQESDQQQSSLRLGTVSITPLLSKSIRKKVPGKSAPNWRIHKKNFVTSMASRVCEPGAVTFSAGWFAQAHTVQYSLLVYNFLITDYLCSLQSIH